MSFFDQGFQDHLDYEFNARYDYISEAYGNEGDICDAEGEDHLYYLMDCEEKGIAPLPYAEWLEEYRRPYFDPRAHVEAYYAATTYLTRTQYPDDEVPF